MLILLDMIITNENLDRTEFNNHLETIGLNNIISNLNKVSIIKRIGYDPLQLDKDKIENPYNTTPSYPSGLKNNNRKVHKNISDKSLAHTC